MKKNKVTSLRIYNSLSKKKEVFEPIDSNDVKLYTCGITAYDHTHIGHIRKYVGDDILKRVLIYNGYEVNHVQNVTDVGHLESDADTGKDKIQKGAEKYNLSVIEVARKFEKEFYSTMDKMNVKPADTVIRAASDDAIEEQIKIVQELLEKDYAYTRDNAIYFNVAKLPDYNPFSNQKLEDKIAGSRKGVVVDKEKVNQADFVLWMFRKGKYKNHAMHWESPWGDGFPGWHIECSAISMKYLGTRIDIHTGGVDHSEVHHPNEIAQNYGVCGHKVVNYWVHHNFLTVDSTKMSKSLGNLYTLNDIKEKGFSAMALRYFILTAHYRKQINFTFEALEGMQNAYNHLLKKVSDFKLKDTKLNLKEMEEYEVTFQNVINDDLNMPDALAVLWKMVQDDKLNDYTKKELIIKFDEVLGLNLIENASSFNDGLVNINDLPKNIKSLIERREKAREEEDFEKSDKLRDELKKEGYKVVDETGGTAVYKQ